MPPDPPPDPEPEPEPEPEPVVMGVDREEGLGGAAGRGGVVSISDAEVLAARPIPDTAHITSHHITSHHITSHHIIRSQHLKTHTHTESELLLFVVYNLPGVE